MGLLVQDLVCVVANLISLKAVLVCCESICCTYLIILVSSWFSVRVYGVELLRYLS